MLKVMIDPGHGKTKGISGGDGGCHPSGSYVERQLMLEMALEMESMLRAVGIEPVLSRREEKYVSINDRCRIANQQGCSYSVSLHRNGSAGHNAYGYETWYDKSNPNSKRLAENIHKAIVGVGVSRDRGVKVANGNYGYLRYPAIKCPAVMPELLFHDWDADNVLWDKNKHRYAQAIVDAIVKTAKEDGLLTENGAGGAGAANGNTGPINGKLYRVQVGAFGVRKNAENMLEKLKRAGFSGIIKED